MFAVNIKRAYTLCDKVFIRTLRNKKISRDNPGLNQRAAVFQEEGIPLDADVEDFLDESEGNFADLGKTYKDYAREKIMEKDTLRHLIVKRKYFKENIPNLLTWSEKEQIRLLNSEEPDEWTPEKLAESFPVTPEVVKKLTKYPWKPATLERIKRHDDSAMRNWRELKEGTLEIPEDLRERLLKFSKRTIPPLDTKSIKVDITPEEIGEFQSIIDKCAKSKTNNEHNNNNSFDEHSKDKQNKSKETHHKLTLDELKDKIRKEMDDGSDVNLSDQIILQNTNETSEIELKNVQRSNLEVERDGKHITMFGNQNPETSVVAAKTYPNRIKIPKKAWKKGGTYKVDDCYYDDDGRFLYRVIGMNN